MTFNRQAGLLFFFVVCHLPAADFFVSPSGSDLTGDGSSANPWKTLSHAAAGTPGNAPNTIRLAAGIYVESAASVINPNVSVIGAGRDLTVVKNGFVGFYLIQLDVGYEGFPDGTLRDGNQTISGFHIEGIDHANRTRQSGIRVKGRHNVTIEGMRFSNMGDGGIDIRAMDSANSAVAPTGYLNGIVVRDSVFENTAKDLYANVLIGGLDGAELSNLMITEGRGVGIKHWGGGWLKNLRIRGCTINMLPPDRVRTASAGDDWPSIELRQVSNGSEISNTFMNHWISLTTSFAGEGTWNLRIRNNRFLYEAGTLQPIQIGNHGTPNLEIAGNYFENIGPSYAVANWPFHAEIDNVSVHHNVFKGTGADSFGVLFQPNNAHSGHTNAGGNIAGIEIFNNTFVDVSDAILIQPLNNHSAEGVAVQNNIFADFTSLAEPRVLVSFNTGGGAIVATNVSNNLFHNIPADKAVAGVSTTASSFEEPDFLDSGLRPRPYYELSASSPAINAGVAIAGFPVADGQTDLGAYEFTGIADADTDGDGQSDAAEHIAGTSPVDPNDVLRIIDVQKHGDQLLLTWTSVPGKTYAVESTTSAFTNWTELLRRQATAARTTEAIGVPTGTRAVHLRVRVC